MLCFFTGNALCQDLKLAGVEYLTYPKVRLKKDAGNYEAYFREFGAFASFPKKLKNNKTILLNGFQYGFVSATSVNTTTQTEKTQQFHKIAYALNVIHKVDERWTIIGRLSPTLASDFNDKLSWKDFLMQGSFIVTKQIKENVIAGAGLVYTTRLGRPLLLPGLQYQLKSDKQALNIFIPAFINYAYSVGTDDKIKIGFRATVNGANFNTASNNFSMGTQVDRLNYARANLGPFANYRLTKMIQIEAYGGLSTMRMYQFVDVHGEKYKYNSNSGAFFNIGLALVPPSLGAKRKDH